MIKIECKIKAIELICGAYLSDGAYAVAAANERREDHVDAVVDAEEQVFLVLLADGRQVDGRAGQVAALLAAQQAAIFDGTLERVGALLCDEQRDETVVDVDVLADVDHLHSQQSHHRRSLP